MSPSADLRALGLSSGWKEGRCWPFAWAKGPGVSLPAAEKGQEVIPFSACKGQDAFTEELILGSLNNRIFSNKEGRFCQRKKERAFQMGNNMRKSQRGWPGGEQGGRSCGLGAHAGSRG